MAILTNGQYARLQKAKQAGDTKLMDEIMSEPYGYDAEVIDVEIELDAEVIEEKMASGMSKAEIGKEFGVSHQKIAAVLKSKDK